MPYQLAAPCALPNVYRSSGAVLGAAACGCSPHVTVGRGGRNTLRRIHQALVSRFSVAGRPRPRVFRCRVPAEPTAAGRQPHGPPSYLHRIPERVQRGAEPCSGNSGSGGSSGDDATAAAQRHQLCCSPSCCPPPAQLGRPAQRWGAAHLYCCFEVLSRADALSVCALRLLPLSTAAQARTSRQLQQAQMAAQAAAPAPEEAPAAGSPGWATPSPSPAPAPSQDWSIAEQPPPQPEQPPPEQQPGE